LSDHAGRKVSPLKAEKEPPIVLTKKNCKILKKFTPFLTEDQKKSIVSVYTKYIFLYNEIIDSSIRSRSADYYYEFENNIKSEIPLNSRFRFSREMPDSVINMSIADAKTSLSGFHLLGQPFPPAMLISKNGALRINDGITVAPVMFKTIISIDKVCNNIMLCQNKHYYDTINFIDIFYKKEREFYFKITFDYEIDSKKGLSLFDEKQD